VRRLLFCKPPDELVKSWMNVASQLPRHGQTTAGRRDRRCDQGVLSQPSDGPVEQQVIQAGALSEGISWRTMERAKSELGVVSQRRGFGPGSVVLWGLPEGEDSHTPPTPLLAVYDGGATSPEGASQ